MSEHHSMNGDHDTTENMQTTIPLTNKLNQTVDSLEHASVVFDFSNVIKNLNNKKMTWFPRLICDFLFVVVDPPIVV